MGDESEEDPKVALILRKHRWRRMLQQAGSEDGKIEALAAMWLVATEEYERIVGAEAFALMLSDAADLVMQRCGQRPAAPN